MISRATQALRIAPLAALILSLLALFAPAQAQQPPAAVSASPYTSSSCPASNAAGVSVHSPRATTPMLSFCDGRPLTSNATVASAGSPRALASADFDEDGVPDLVSAFSAGNGGQLTIHRGNVAALWPYGSAVANGIPQPFFADARTVTVPESPDFVVTGDFDADGHSDIITARKGSTSLYFLKGDGHGNFAPAKKLTLSGAITALIAGEMNRSYGVPVFVVALTSAASSTVAVFESPRGAINASPESFALPHAGTALALSHFDGGAMNDLAVAAGNQLVVIHARDRKLVGSLAQSALVPPARISQLLLPYAITTLAAGDFTEGAAGLAVLAGDGRVHILDHAATQSSLAAQLARDPNFVPTFALPHKDRDGKPVIISGHITPATAARFAALRESAAAGAEWTERYTVELPSGFASSGSAAHLIAAHVTGSRQQDILAVDGATKQIHVLSTMSAATAVAEAASRSTMARTVPAPGSIAATSPMQLVASISSESAPAAILPMRLNQHGLHGLVVLQAGQAAATVMPQDVPPANIFTVTNTKDLDATASMDPPPAGSLRAAIIAANGAVGTSSIVFNIPTSDPNYNAADGSFTIFPLSEGVPNDFNDFALPPINATVTIDGYTQPGASPNTSAAAGNAKILIRIDGSKATTPGGSGFSPFDDLGSVFRGMDFTTWTNPDVSSGNTASGAWGIEANGVGDFIEGNYFGTDPTGLLTHNGTVNFANRIGVFADNGPGLGNTDSGNMIGGTTPQARNVLSNNLIGGVLYLSTAIEGHLEGNFLGLDASGAKAMGNVEDGAGANGPTVTFGGTLAGDANVISANGTNVDFNDLTNGGQANGSSVLGNLIGTDVTGKLSISNGIAYGVSVTAGAINENVGGVTSAARNVISGNLAGVFIADDVLSTNVFGNYIGVDITGAKALGNATQGVLQEASSSVPAGLTNLGGSVPGAGNVISGNAADGVSISGAAPDGAGDGGYDGNTILGNFIGTDSTGKTAIPNNGNGILLLSGASQNVIGGSQPGQGNLISNNTGDGVHIDPVNGGGEGDNANNNTVGNVIQSNGGTGVRIISGTQNRISQNSIYANGALGIDIDGSGENTNTHCNSTNSGANLDQNAPVLNTGGTGSTFVTATATDSNGNTSEFSNAVPADQSGNTLSLMGNFDSVGGKSYTIEFFSSPKADSSGFGEGQTYLGSTSVSTDATACTVTVNNPINTAQIDLSVSLTGPYALQIGPDFGTQDYTATVANNGPATAHSVVLTDTLPDGVTVSSAYCNVAPCVSPVTTSFGSCSVSGATVTCNIGTLAAGQQTTVSIPVNVTVAGSISDTASVTATEVDSNPANNTATLTKTSSYPDPYIDYGSSGTIPTIVPSSAVAGSPDLVVTIYGDGFIPQSVVSFNGANLATNTFIDNQICGGQFEPYYCAAIQVTVPASMLTAAGTPTIAVTNPGLDAYGENNPSTATFNIVASCSLTPESDIFSPIENDGTTLIPEQVYVSANAPTCSWTASSSVSWIVPLESTTQTGTSTLDFAIAPNTGSASRTGNVTVAGTAFSVTQDGGASCDYSLTPTSQAVAAAGGSQSVNVTIIGGSSCAPFVEATQSWITIPENSGLLINSGPAGYSVAANTGAPRTGTVMIGGYVLTVNQAAPACYYTLSSTTALWGVDGGKGSFTVTPSGSSCAWTAKSSDSSLLSVTSGASGTGNGTVKYTLNTNSGGPQTPAITVADSNGSASTFTITQASAYSCTFTISPSSIEVNSQGTSNYFVVTPSNSFCQFTAASNDPTALSIQGRQGEVIYYAVGQNTTGAARALTITAGCQSFTVNQDAPATTNPSAPTITTLSPASATAGGAAFALTVNGTNFVSGSTVNFNGVAKTTTFVSATQLTAAILATDIATAGTPAVTVTNPSGGGTSNSVNFTITASSNPLPAVTTISPTSATAGGAAFTLTVNGTNFVAASVVKFNGVAKTTTFVSATKLTAAIAAADITAAGTPAVAVTNPTPGGGTSNSVTFTINAASNPVPAITTLSPSTIAAGSAAFTLTVNGSNFVSTSVVKFGGTAKTTTYVSATQLTAAIVAADVATAGTPAVTVTNPTPGGGTSNSVTFTITAAQNPVPAITTISPSTIAAGSAAFTLTVNGSNFVANSVVKFNGTAKTTTFVSATKLTAAIAAGDVTSSGTPTVTVTNPTPGGGTSNSVTFTITATQNPVPAITTLSPSTIAAGSAAFTLTVNGSNFVANSVVKFGGTAKTTTFVSATQLTAAIAAADITTAGTPAVTVTNPTPGGGTSNSVTFTINAAQNPVPTITTLSPTNVNAGAAAFTLTVNGTNFVAASTVKFGGTAKTTTFVSATQLTAAITAADVATAGTPAVTVTNPTPGGGTSNSVTFTINAASNPVPAITTLAPSTAVAGSAAFTLTVNGSNFVAASSVKFNGSAKTTTFVSATQLTAAITAADIATAGTPAVTVTNPTPGGGTSNSVTFTITASGTPQAVFSPTSLSFASTQAGATSTAQAVTLSNPGSAALTINGISIAGANAADFTQTNTCGASVAAGANCTINVTFAPASAASFTASISVADNAAASPQSVALSGTGTAAATFTVASGTPTQTVKSGGIATYAITVAAQNGTLANPVSLSVMGLPTGASATFSPSSVAPGSASATSTLTVQTGATANAITATAAAMPLAAILLPFFGLLLPAGEKRRRWIAISMLALAVTCASATLIGCSGGSKSPGGGAQTYTLTITGASGTQTQSTTVQLVVQ